MTSERTAHVCVCGWGARDHRLAAAAAKDRAVMMRTAQVRDARNFFPRISDSARSEASRPFQALALDISLRAVLRSPQLYGFPTCGLCVPRRVG